MPTVSNTSPILNLAIIDRLSLLHSQFGVIWVPPAVIRELRMDEDLPGSAQMRGAVDEGWIKIEEVQDALLVRSLLRELDQGEAEAIALSCRMQAARVLLDEAEGRRVAKSMGLRVTGTLGVLLRACRMNDISSLRRDMQDLREKAGFRISDALFDEILRSRDT